jgi:hypothetical protein
MGTAWKRYAMCESALRVQLRPFTANGFRYRDESKFCLTVLNPRMRLNYHFHIAFKELNSISSCMNNIILTHIVAFFNQSRRLCESRLGITNT